MDWIRTQIAKLLNATILSKYIGSWIRTALAGLGGVLVSKGILANTDAVNQLVSPIIEIAVGIVSYLIAQGASIKEKQVRKETKDKSQEAGA